MEELLKQILEKVSSMDTRLGKLEEAQEFLNSQTLENTQILKALEHKSEINKAEHEKMFNEIVEISGNIAHLTQVTESINSAQKSQAEILDILSSRSIKQEAEMKSFKKIQVQIVE